MSLTSAELNNLTTLVEVGAKASAADRGLQEAAAILNTSIQLLRKLHEMHATPPAQVENTGPTEPK